MTEPMVTTVSGPVTGGRHGWAFGRPIVDLADFGYCEEEFFLEGTAERYRPVDEAALGRDGRWRVEPVERRPFKTRMIVYRPIDAEAFNGTVLVSWNNVSAGYELFGGDTPEVFEGGFVFVGVTTQLVGVEGLPPTPKGLAAWDPERYGSLTIPGDDFSYDIFTRAARAIGPNRDRSGVDPLGGLEPRKLIATGASQSAGRLATYVNAIHPRSGAFDAYLLTIYFGTGSGLEVGEEVINLDAIGAGAALSRALAGTHLLRDDLDVPVMVVNSELEAIACLGVRQPDTESFRYWEAAGTCHVSRQGLELRAKKYERDFATPLPIAEGINALPMAPLFDTALRHLHHWVNDGPPPPSQPKIDFIGDPPQVDRDVHGLARGGIRMPQVEVPLAQNSAIPLAEDIYSVLYGSSTPFDRATIRELYVDRDDFLERFEAAARAAEKTGVLLARDVEHLLREARGLFPDE
jgi:hypothetical protein